MVLSSVLSSNTMNFDENPHGNAILEMLRSQRIDGRFCDIVLHVSNGSLEEKLFPAHRSVLAAVSQYFESVLKTHRVTKEQISISCQDIQVFEILLDYMYSGSITIEWDNVNELLKLSNYFLMEKVTNYCTQFLEHYLKVDTCLSIRDLAEKYNLELLITTTNEFISENLNDVIEQPFMIEMSAKKLETIINDPIIGFTNFPVSQLLTFFISWVKNDIPRRSKEFDHFLSYIEWDKMKLEFIYDHIDTETLYQDSKTCLYYALKSLFENNLNIDRYNDIFKELNKNFNKNKTKISEENNESDNEMIVPNMDEQDLMLRNSPISVEPVEFVSITRTRSKSHNFKERTSSSIANIRSETSESKRRTMRSRKAENASISSVENEELVPRTRKRNSKQKYSKNEWVVYSPSVSKKKNTSIDSEDEKLSINKKREMEIEPIEDFESETNLEDEAEEDEVERSDDNLSQNYDDMDEDSSLTQRKRSKLSIARNKIQSASLAHWKEGVKCPHCIYVGHSATRLEQHLSRVHEEDTTYKCKMCSFVCKWNREYYKHMKSHFDGPPYKCEDCEYSCDRIQFILSHRMRHTDERPYHCELCNFKSRTKGNLIVHMRIHTGEKPYKCPHCGRSFAMKNTLDQHLATHRDDRPFLCDSCGFTTKYQSHLLSHKRIHTGNVFHCEQSGCTYSSPRRSQLAAHMRSHLSIRSHICSTCGRAFIEKSHLIRHERIHLDEKPFKCEQCDYGSTRRDKLKEHVLKHHSSDSSAKTPYKPRKPRRQNQQTGYIIEQSDENSIHSQSQQLAIVSSPQEIQISQSQLSDQELCTATASLIYEYSSGEVTVSPARVVIQPTVAYTGDVDQQLVERIVEHQRQTGNNSNNARVVIQSIPSATYVSNNQTLVDKIMEQQNNERNLNPNNNDMGGLSAFMALF